MTKQTLYPNKTKFVFFLLLALMFHIIGILMILDGKAIGWFVAITFGIGTIIFALNLIPQASYLKLDEEGFETCSLFRKHTYSWSEISHFKVGTISNNKMVIFDYSEEFNKQHTARKIASVISGGEGGLHDTFGMKATELADLMNAYKRKFG